MPPIQNTFSIIPDIPSAINANRHGAGDDATSARPSRPPMTTKQVKKAYQKANKGPKLSKAEQRRQELFEQDRIRKEFEKEKHQARARAARDKKKEKEERERAEKKRKGLPLVDVRASQDTIARFVRPKPKSQGEDSATPYTAVEALECGPGLRGDSPGRDDSKDQGLAQQLDEANKENIEPHDEFKRGPPASHPVSVENGYDVDDRPPITDHLEPQQKKRKIDVFAEEKESYDEPLITANGVASPQTNHEASMTSDCMKRTSSANAEQRKLNRDDSFSTIDFGEEDLFDDFLRKGESAQSPPNASNKRIFSQHQSQNPPIEPPPPKPPEDGSHLPSPQKIERASGLDRKGDSTKPSLSPQQVAFPPPVKNTVKTPHRSSMSERTSQVLAPNPIANPSASNVRRFQPVAPSSRSFQHPRTPMAPPPGPPKFRPAKPTSTNQPKPPQFLKPALPSPRTPLGGSCRSRMTKPEEIQEDKPPPSTQLFILSHLDDFLPSPSQEVREIFDEPKRNHCETRSKQVPLMGTYTRHKAPEPKPRVSQVPTPSYKRHAASTPIVNPVRSRITEKVVEQPKPQQVASPRFIQPPQPNTESTFDIPFFSTQDLLLSSQDVKDIEEDPPPPPPPKAQAPTPTPRKDDTKPQDSPRRSPKRLFTSSFREMRYKYVLERNKTAAWEGPGARQKAREELDKLQALEDARLEALLANSDEGEGVQVGVTVAGSCAADQETLKKHSPDAQPRGTPTPQAPSPQPARIEPCGKSARSSIPSSGSISDGVARNHTRKPPDAQHSRPGTGGNGSGSSRTSHRPTRPKSSYEAMLELLAKGPAAPPPHQQKQKQKQKPPSARFDEQRGKVAMTGQAGERNQAAQFGTVTTTVTTKTTIPASSQETDYDCGEEWDDDDLLCDML